MASEQGDRAGLGASIAASFGPGQARHGRDGDAVDDVVPSLAITARSIDDVLTVVEEARRCDLGVIVAGGGTSLGTGNRPAAYDIRLGMTGMASIVERRPEDMTVTVEAGVTLGRLNRVLAANGQRIALDPLLPDRRTIGGVVATSATGGLFHGFGGPRDLVLGMTVADGTGRILEIGGRVVKNVAGYDLVRLFTGSFGTLGVITRVTLRTHPAPERVAVLSFPFDRGAELEAVCGEIRASELALASLDFKVGGDHGWRLVARLEGTKSEVDYQQERLTALAGRPAQLLAEDAESPVHPPADAAVVIRAGVIPTAAADLADTLLPALGGRCSMVRISGRLGDGHVHVAATPSEPADALALIRIVRSCTDEHAGRAIVERAPAPAKVDLDVWGGRPQGFRLMQQIKKRFDPSGLFARGRFVGGL
jgi:glycolate oxidase FAD binding subunit